MTIEEVMHVEPSAHVHSNQVDEVFLRVGDKSKKLGFDDRLQLTYDKGERFFEDKPVPEAEMDDLDMDFVGEYIKRIGYQKSAISYLTENKGFVKTKDGKMQISTAAILLFGRNPQNFFPRARVRFIRYDGTEERFGAEMNVVKDVIFEGNILKMVTDSVSLKAYNYVKEYGEGVDRIYQEMSDAGLQEPQYYTNAFLLQTVVYNTKRAKTDAIACDIAVEDKKRAIRYEKLAIGDEKRAIGYEKRAIEDKKLAIGDKERLMWMKNWPLRFWNQRLKEGIIMNQP